MILHQVNCHIEVCLPLSKTNQTNLLVVEGYKFVGVPHPSEVTFPVIVRS